MQTTDFIIAAPSAIRALPRDSRGYPIPFFVATLDDGSRDLRIACGRKRIRCFRESLCWICGEKLNVLRAFIGGPLSVANRVFSDAWMHPGCATFAMIACPFLNGEMSRRPGKAVPVDTFHLSGAVEGRPDRQAVYLTRARVEMHPEGHFLVGKPVRVQWWRDGVLEANHAAQ